MKSIIKNTVLIGLILTLFGACKKDTTLSQVNDATAVVLTSSTSNLILDGNNATLEAVNFSFTSANYNVSAPVSYILQMDKEGNGFSNAKEYQLSAGILTKAFTTSEINTALLDLKFVGNVIAKLEVRVKSFLGTSSSILYSNVVTLTVKPYDVAVQLPASDKLFIIGDATDFGWDNIASPAFAPERVFAKLDNTHWAGIFNLSGASGTGYKLLVEQGNWDAQYHMVTGGTDASGSFAYGNTNPFFPTPATAGAYKIIFDFQAGTYTATAAEHPVIANLYITGDATNSGWTDDITINQKMTKINAVEFEATVALKATGQFKFLTGNSWNNQVGATNGVVKGKYNSTTPEPDAIAAPASAGNYKLKINFATSSYTLNKI